MQVAVQETEEPLARLEQQDQVVVVHIQQEMEQQILDLVVVQEKIQVTAAALAATVAVALSLFDMRNKEK
jgi:hypothetical protein